MCVAVSCSELQCVAVSGGPLKVQQVFAQSIDWHVCCSELQ